MKLYKLCITSNWYNHTKFDQKQYLNLSKRYTYIVLGNFPNDVALYNEIQTKVKLHRFTRQKCILKQ